MGDRSFLDAQDRRWLAKKRDTTIFWVFLIIVVGLAIAYWPLVVVAVVVAALWLVGRRMNRKVWFWNEAAAEAQQATRPVTSSIPAVPKVARSVSPARKKVNTVLIAIFTFIMLMIPVGFVGLCLFWFIAAHTR